MDFDLEQIRQVFVAETEEDLGIVEQALLKLEKAPEDVECVATLFRKFHTLKGNAASLEFDRLSEFAHRLEDLLDTLRSAAPRPSRRSSSRTCCRPSTWSARAAGRGGRHG